jgi:hypothetical protein
MSDSPICKEKYQDGKLVSRLCIKGDIFFLKHEFARPEYELSQVESCEQCPVFPPPAKEMTMDEVKDLIRNTLKDNNFLKDLFKEILDLTLTVSISNSRLF